MNKKFSALAAGVKKALIPTLVLSTSTAVYAADQQPDKKKATKEDIEQIEVRSYAASVEKSINMKRFSNSVVDAVSAEDIGKFPD
ncbi:hypothetical protein [Pseudoalteromonas gelatinilytica]